MKRIGNRQDEYWRRNVGLTLALLLLWLLVTFVAPFYARELYTMSFLAFPLGFYMAAQGNLVIYLALIWFYNRRMRKVEEECGIGDE